MSLIDVWLGCASGAWRRPTAGLRCPVTGSWNVPDRHQRRLYEVFLAKGLTGLLVLGAVVARRSVRQQQAAAVPAAASSGGSSSERRSGGKTIDIYSSLPLQGAVNAQTIPAGQRDQARARPGRRQGGSVHGQLHLAGRLDGDLGRDHLRRQPVGRRTPARPRPIRRPSTTSASSTRAAAKVTIPILNQAGRPPGQPGEHVRRPDHERPGQCARRAAEVLPNRQADVLADRSARLDPGRGGPESR